MLVSTYHVSDEARANARRHWIDARPVVIGSAPDCHVVIDDPEVAAHHLRLSMRDALIVVENLASPADVDGVPLPPNTTMLVAEGRPIRIGGTIVKVRGQPSAMTGSSPSIGQAPSRPPTRMRPKLGVLSDDPTEQAFLAALRTQPADAATRAAYAAWLAQRGLTAKAELVQLRDHLDTYIHRNASEIEWRAVVVRTPVDHCILNRCPESWDALAPKTDDWSRYCGNCSKHIAYCGDLNEVRAAAFDGHPCVFDAGLDRVLAHEAYRRFAEQPVLQADDDDDSIDDDPDGYTVDTSSERR